MEGHQQLKALHTCCSLHQDSHDGLHMHIKVHISSSLSSCGGKVLCANNLDLGHGLMLNAACFQLSLFSQIWIESAVYLALA